MTSPDFQTFKKLARKGNLVALSATVPADLETPVSAFLKLAANAPHAFLLESAEQEEHIGRYSFIGLEPEAVLTDTGSGIKIQSRNRGLKFASGPDLASVIEKAQAKFRLANPETLPAFAGGFVGYLGYENVEHFEAVRLAKRPGPKIPKSVFFLTQDLVIFDHFRKTLSLVVIVNTAKNKSMKSLYAKAEATIRHRIQVLQKPLAPKRAPKAARALTPKSNLTSAQFYAGVNRIKEYIRAGDAIQVVFSQRFKLPHIPEDFQIYRALRSINPSPYMFYFRAGKLRLVGSSPELLVKKEGTRAEVRPIAGTRPRGKTEAEDLAFEDHMKKSPKEMAEHLMLVDLGRNDLGRVCQFDSIRVENFARVERYSHVMHLVSDVVGRLKSGKTSFDLLRATFPAGTVSGAPKIRAMQIINELEPETRGVYAGALGYFSFNHDMDMCIAIRTLVLDGKNTYLQAGAGIVKDSDPKREYQESVNKARALLKAIEMRGNF